MPLIIDAPPISSQLAAARALITAELPRDRAITLYPNLPTVYEPRSSAVIQIEHARLASGAPRDPDTGIDLSRYEAVEAPSTNSPEAWRGTLQQAYVSLEYLRGREINLGLLETYGKNAWLVGNSQLEAILAGLERDIESTKRVAEATKQERRDAQSNAAGEMVTLEESWRKGVGRMIETQAAAEGLRREVLERKRMGAR